MYDTVPRDDRPRLAHDPEGLLATASRHSVTVVPKHVRSGLRGGRTTSALPPCPPIAEFPVWQWRRRTRSC
jgi:hypothetical protein